MEDRSYNAKKIILYIFTAICIFFAGFLSASFVGGSKFGELESRIIELDNSNKQLQTINSRLEDSNQQLRETNSRLEEYSSQFGQALTRAENRIGESKSIIEQLEISINESDTITGRISEIIRTNEKGN